MNFVFICFEVFIVCLNWINLFKLILNFLSKLLAFWRLSYNIFCRFVKKNNSICHFRKQQIGGCLFLSPMDHRGCFSPNPTSDKNWLNPKTDVWVEMIITSKTSKTYIYIYRERERERERERRREAWRAIFIIGHHMFCAPSQPSGNDARIARVFRYFPGQRRWVLGFLSYDEITRKLKQIKIPCCRFPPI
jgi:hypothetical protein